MVSFFSKCLLGFCVFSFFTISYAEEVTTQVWQNNATLYLEENGSSPGQGVIRIDVRKDSMDPQSFVLEFNETNISLIEPFLAARSAEIGPSCDTLNLLAIGDFSSADMQALFETYFSSIEIKKSSPLVNDSHLCQDTKPSGLLLSGIGESVKYEPAAFQRRDMHNNNSSELFYQLPLVDWEMKTIHKIIDTMAEKNVFQLALEKSSMEKKGKKIRHVHPLRFVGYVYGDGHLKRCMHEIKKSYFKWHSFLDGFGEKMHEEYRANNLAQYVPGFSQSLGVNQDSVMQYINDKDWEGLLKFLL